MILNPRRPKAVLPAICEYVLSCPTCSLHSERERKKNYTVRSGGVGRAGMIERVSIIRCIFINVSHGWKLSLTSSRQAARTSIPGIAQGCRDRYQPVPENLELYTRNIDVQLGSLI